MESNQESKKVRTLNPREVDVLSILWNKGEPMMATDIVNEGHGLTQSTVTAVLRRLLNEELVEVTGITHSGRVLSRTYIPTEASRAVITKNIVDFYKSVSAAITPSELCVCILKHNGDAQEASSELERLIDMLKN